jgi:hypothetical protein
MRTIANKPTSDTLRLVDRLGGIWHGNVAMCRCPAHDDGTPSLSIRQGDRSILVTCFAGCARTDVLRAISKQATIPITSPSLIERSEGTRSNPHWAIWQSALPVAETIGERYLSQIRGLTLPLAHIRFHPRCPRGKGTQARFEPALIVAMHHGRRITAIQRIFLDRTTARCIDKIVLGRSIGAAWTNDQVSERLALAEGFETAAAYTQLKGIPAWSAMGARRLPQLWLPPMVRTVILLRDNDPEGRAAERKAALAYRERGLTVVFDPPPTHVNDWADLLTL